MAIINLGTQDRWLLGQPSPIQMGGGSSVVGNGDRWLLGQPPIIGADEYVAAGGAPRRVIFID